MIGSHPGGIALTKRLIALGKLAAPARVLDLGAGEGESVVYLREQGFEALGIDRADAGDRVVRQDMRATSFPDVSWDACLAECSVSVCGDGKRALKEACRILKPGGSLLLSDVFFRREDAPFLSLDGPLTLDGWKRAFTEAGFVLRALADETALWREFFLASLWNGNADAGFCGFFREAGKAGCGYFLAWLQKGEEHGVMGSDAGMVETGVLLRADSDASGTGSGGEGGSGSDPRHERFKRRPGL